MTKLDLDIGVIYTYERDYMHPLIDTMSQSGSGIATRLLLVDNVSAGVSDWTTQFAQTQVIRNASRLGYAANLNRILEASTARYVLLLNTDMYFEPSQQTLTKMVQFMDAHPDCGLSGCRLYHPHGAYGHPARRYFDWKMIAARRLGLARMFPHALTRYMYREVDSHTQFDCDWLSGCFLLVRREAFEQVGYLDCGFRKYFEDVDYCRRMHDAGWRVMLNGDTWCYHWEQRASANVFSKDAVHHFHSFRRWLWKWEVLPRLGGNPLQINQLGPVLAPPTRHAA